MEGAESFEPVLQGNLIMSVASIRYQFSEGVAFEDVEGALVVAVLAIESLHGPAAVRLGTAYAADPLARTVVVESSSDVGRDLNRVFVGFLSRDLATDAFTVERRHGLPAPVRVALA